MSPVRNKKQFFIPILSLAILFAFGAIIVHGQQGNPPTDGGNPPTDGGNPPITKLINPFRGPDSLAELLKVVVNDILIPVGAVLAVLAFIFTGFKFVAAQGKPDKLKEARNMLLYTSIGTAVLLGAWMLATVICKTIGQLGGPICPI